MDPPLYWYTKVWTHRDLAGRTLITRHGDDNLGYLHYAQPHNVISERPIGTAYQDNSPNVYRTPDGTPIGTITAYCDGMQRCPDFIN